MRKAKKAPDVHRWGGMNLVGVQPAYDVIDRIVQDGPELYLKFIAEQCLRGLRQIGTRTARKMVQDVADSATETDRADWAKRAEE